MPINAVAPDVSVQIKHPDVDGRRREDVSSIGCAENSFQGPIKPCDSGPPSKSFEGKPPMTHAMDKATARYNTMRNGTSLSGQSSGATDGATSDKSVRKASRCCGTLRSSWVIYPQAVKYQRWLRFVVMATLLAAWLEPFDMAFGPVETVWNSPTHFWSMQTYFASVIFMIDMALKFFVAYMDPEDGGFVENHRLIAINYVTSYKFVPDMFSALPLDYIIDAVEAKGGSQRVAMGVHFIKMLYLVRFYRVFEFFHQLDYMLIVSQGTLMVIRNTTYALYVTHWAACILYLIAIVEGRTPDSWLGRNSQRFVGRPASDCYILSLYFSVSAFTGLGDGELFASTVPEAAFMIVYLLFNLFLGAYILGTVTMLVVKEDERSKQFRDRMRALADFSKSNELPKPLHSAMQEHLEVTFLSDQASDEQVLGIYPNAIRRKVLRHLYLQPVRSCYIFKGCKQRFLDAVLTAARVELFMPGVQVVTEGDNVSELLIVISGSVALAQHSINVAAAYSHFAAQMMGTDGSASRRNRLVSREGSLGGGRTYSRTYSGRSSFNSRTSSIGDIAGAETRYEGAALAEVPFFTDVPCYETAMSTSVVRALSLSKASWELLVEQFPQQTRMVLENLQARQEDDMHSTLQAAAMASQLTAEQLDTALSLIRAKDGLESVEPQLVTETRAALTQTQMDQLVRLDDIRSLVRAHVHKVDQMRIYRFLQQAAVGDVETLRNMLMQGMSANSADYDGRTGLMLAAAAGHEDVVRLLLDHGARVDHTDSFGNSALSEACKAGNDKGIELLLGYGATLGKAGLEIAGTMCTAVFEGDLTKLRRLLRAGAPPDACDYDKRSALHIAGAEGNLAAVKLLIEEGGADPNFQDRWGNTALDEARRVGATPVVSYLEGLVSHERLTEIDQRYRRHFKTDFLAACRQGDVGRLTGMYGGARPPCPHTALLVAATEGQTASVEVLVKYSHPQLLERAGAAALLDAAELGHVEVVRLLRRLGVILPHPAEDGLIALLESAVIRQDALVVLALLDAGIDVAPKGPAGNSKSTVLHLAACSGNLDLVRLLVELGGASAIAPNATGNSAAALAEQAAASHPSSRNHRTVSDYLSWAAAQGDKVNPAAAVARHGPLPDVASVTPAPLLNRSGSKVQGVSSACPIKPRAALDNRIEADGLMMVDEEDDDDILLLAMSPRTNSLTSSRSQRRRSGSVHNGARRVSTIRMLAKPPDEAPIFSGRGLSFTSGYSQPSTESVPVLTAGTRTGTTSAASSIAVQSSGASCLKMSRLALNSIPDPTGARVQTSGAGDAAGAGFRSPSLDLVAIADGSTRHSVRYRLPLVADKTADTSVSSIHRTGSVSGPVLTGTVKGGSESQISYRVPSPDLAAAEGFVHGSQLPIPVSGDQLDKSLPPPWSHAPKQPAEAVLARQQSSLPLVTAQPQQTVSSRAPVTVEKAVSSNSVPQPSLPSSYGTQGPPSQAQNVVMTPIAVTAIAAAGSEKLALGDEWQSGGPSRQSFSRIDASQDAPRQQHSSSSAPQAPDLVIPDLAGLPGFVDDVGSRIAFRPPGSASSAALNVPPSRPPLHQASLSAGIPTEHVSPDPIKLGRGAGGRLRSVNSAGSRAGSSVPASNSASNSRGGADGAVTNMRGLEEPAQQGKSPTEDGLYKLSPPPKLIER